MTNRDQLVSILLRAVSDGHCLDSRADLEELADYISADVAPVVHGRWVNSHDNPVAFSKHDSRCPSESCYCSECHEWLTASDEYDCLGNYCPNCGAKMDLEVKTND